ncbi:MAG: sugar transferase [Chloroflexota bacterium]|nr:sugar transferase [Chloroflexota bacterium]
MLRYNLRYQLFLILSDIGIVIGALAFSSFLRIHIDVGAEPLTSSAFLTPRALFGIAPLLWLFAFHQAGVYRPGDRARAVVRRVIAGHLLASLLFLGALYVTYRDYSRLQAFYFLVVALIGTLSFRALLSAAGGRLRHTINTPRRIAIVETGSSAVHLAARITPFADAGLLVVGIIRASKRAENASADALSVLGTIDDLPDLVTRHAIDEILIDAQWLDPAIAGLVAHITQTLEPYPINIRLAHDYSDLAYFRATSEDFNGVTLISLREAILSPLQRILKRLFDLAFALLALMISAPLWVIIALAIRLDSPGAIIFQQRRIGQHGKPFTIYKFRTMIDGADGTPHDMKTVDDPRVTPVGRILRRTSLDELPQFINVLRGEMSIVGPRPEQAHLVERYESWQRKRFEVPQGITGWWQVSGRADKPMNQHTEDDLFYVQHYSLWLDVQIVFRTIWALITGRGAY